MQRYFVFCSAMATFDINLVQLGNSCGCRKITYLKKYNKSKFNYTAWINVVLVVQSNYLIHSLYCWNESNIYVISCLWSRKKTCYVTL